MRFLANAQPCLGTHDGSNHAPLLRLVVSLAMKQSLGVGVRGEDVELPDGHVVGGSILGHGQPVANSRKTRLAKLPNASSSELDSDESETDVVGPPLRLERHPAGRPTGPPVVAPSAAPAHPRKTTLPVLRRLHRRQIRVVAALQLSVIPIPTPLEDVSVHIVQPPGVGEVAADLGGPFS